VRATPRASRATHRADSSGFGRKKLGGNDGSESPAHAPISRMGGEVRLAGFEPATRGLEDRGTMCCSAGKRAQTAACASVRTSQELQGPGPAWR
jgi:hypothetical protein